MSRFSSSASRMTALVALVAIASATGLAQVGPGGRAPDPVPVATNRGTSAEPIPPRPGWAEVIAATPRWLVIQNERGQQFPLEISKIGLFPVRWPAGPERLAIGTLAEIVGVDLGANRIEADHVDLFEGP